MKNNQQGRSMIEMLGVLSIIGILSVAGIVGYSKAMFRYRMNRTVDIVTTAIMNLYEMTDKASGRTANEIYTAQDMIDYGIYPECQPVDNAWGEENGACKLPIGSLGFDYELGSSNPYFPRGTGEFFIFFDGPKECIEFASQHWENVAPADIWPPHGAIFLTGYSLYNPYENKFSYTSTEIAELCNEGCVNAENCNVELAFHGEL